MHIDKLCSYARFQSDSRSALRRASCLVGQRAGIVRRIYSNVRGSDDPLVYQAYAEPSGIDTFNHVPAANRGAACDLKEEDAAIRALGECVERYCGAIYDPHSFRQCSFDEISSEGTCAIDPEQLTLFSAEQYADEEFPFVECTRESTFSWVPGYCLTRDTEAYLPASFVYVPYRFDMLSEFPSHIPISTGLAAAPSLADAVVKGILEILERDAFMIAWRNRLFLKEIDLNAVYHRDINKIVEACATTGGTWKVLQLPSDIPIPILMSVLVNEDGLPKTSFGACAALDPMGATIGAMKESLLTRYYVNYILRNQQGIVATHMNSDYRWVRTLEDHAIVHAIDGRLRDHLFSICGETKKLPEITPDHRHPLQILVSALLENNFDVYYCDVTTRDVAEAGIHVARVIIPGMQPLDNDHRYPHEGRTRLYDLPVKLGFRASRYEREQLNPLPHPFP